MLQIIGGKHKKRKIHTPKGTSVRPTASRLREALFNICQKKVEHAHFLDLFAGSGAIGLEALSRGAAQATFVEIRRSSLTIIQQNIQILGEEEHARTLLGDAIKLLPSFHEPFDLIYADPPYRQGLGAQVLQVIDTLPILADHGILFIEDAHLDIPPLTTLALQNKRQVGQAILFEFIRSS